MKRILLALLVLVPLACTTYTDTNPFDGEEQKPAHIRGTVTRITADTLVVEADPERPADRVKGTITLAATTTYDRLDGTSATLADIRPGNVVSVWIEGLHDTVAPDYPVQGVAVRVAIER